MVVGALGDDVMLQWSRHREVHCMMLLVLVVERVILVPVRVLRGHVMVSRVLIVMRGVSVTLVILVSLRVVALVEPALGLLGMFAAFVASLVRLLAFVVVSFALVRLDGLVVRDGMLLDHGMVSWHGMVKRRGGWRLVSIDQVPVRVSNIVMSGNHDWFLVNSDSVNVMLISCDHYMMDDVLDDLDGMGHCMVQRCLVNLSMVYWSCMMNNWL